jgi:multiple antibiotic resistance protein
MHPESGPTSIFSLALSIFIVFNALGFMPIVMALLSHYDTSRQKKIITRECLIALGILLLFCFFGNKVLDVIGVPAAIVTVAGGVLLFLISLTMIFPPSPSDTKGLPRHEPFIVPIALPGLAGPASIATVIVFTNQVGALETSLATLIAWLPSFVILYLSSYIRNFLGDKGIQAVERLGGFLICLIGSKMVLLGTFSMIKENF